MDTRSFGEYLVLVACALLLLILMIPALGHARRESRDGIQRENLAHVKRMLEDENNKLGYYPASFSATPYGYYVTMKEGKKALGWYVRAPIENPQVPGTYYDAEEGHNFHYRYVQEDGKIFYEICGGEYSC
ncbi:MAG: hypothetical protein A3C02_03065 [Candidatus Andersenbacteria bacterium RIFCSPHIGHO2_02_FULL_45_11]|uniref:Type II secretion system protein GspG C-terminal domain-containing protein n=1 Tax=Candidatus Andersenbacteria bacterium RIFCSPHIGHO2_12_FULL_45_11 TaxID=1797281 RepID=A0A1G1X1B8_9BACT|nr:MAG: hypothetical protein A3C02_03065 [Candidatus Andersenbacteria bacterium RIFCSPHIGHO2_02_FULL_45_11]OGY33591.1 MAG: hypothetical protein A3D99_00030 [Candidatus Andersenbacteria bacterium RIFCSPHIGHO2_12_FULL_45_11]